MTLWRLDLSLPIAPADREAGIAYLHSWSLVDQNITPTVGDLITWRDENDIQVRGRVTDVMSAGDLGELYTLELLKGSASLSASAFQPTRKTIDPERRAKIMANTERLAQRERLRDTWVYCPECGQRQPVDGLTLDGELVLDTAWSHIVPCIETTQQAGGPV